MGLTQDEKARELRCWLVVRMFDPMPWPKMLAQAGHGFVNCLEKARRYGDQWNDRVDAYLATSQPRIIVRAKNENDLLKVEKACLELEAPIPCHLVVDEGRTVFREPTPMVVCVGPCYQHELPPAVRRLRLLEI